MTRLQIPVNEMRVCARGEVVRGDQRGRRLGFPTANIAIDAEGFLVPDGVYAGYLHRYDGSCHAAAISLGVEMLNLKLRKKQAVPTPVELHQPYR